MTVRVLLADKPVYRPRRRWRGLEYVFLLFGLIALDYYVWVNTEAVLSQAYESWSFEQDLRGQPASVRGFISEEIARLTGGRTADSGTKAVAQRETPAKPSVTTRPEPLAVIGRIEIPRLHVNVMVREGVTDQTLRQAVGHVPSTALPGELGNVALAAHRDTFFRPLQDIKKDDHITLETLNGSYEYVVESLKVVSPRDVWVLDASNGSTLTLVTCYPFHYIGSAPKRFIVRATQVTALDGRGAQHAGD